MLGNEVERGVVGIEDSRLAKDKVRSDFDHKSLTPSRSTALPTAYLWQSNSEHAIE